MAPALALAGCATTRIDVTTPEGLRVRASFPKNLDATELVLKVGGYELTADRLRTDAATVIDAQGRIATEVSEAVVTAAGTALVP